MLVPISEITVNPGRRETALGDVRELADSILEVGLINPIMADQTHTLIAGLHRLEAMKLLGRTEIECAVSDLDSLQVALAEIDENFVRKDLSDDEFRDAILPQTAACVSSKVHCLSNILLCSKSFLISFWIFLSRLSVARSLDEAQTR